MKKFSKILIMILSLALLIGSVVAVGASAEESNTREILAKNVAYTDNVTMLFAVDASLDEAIAGTVKVAYYWEEDGVAVIKEAKLLYPYDENDNEIDQYIYHEGGEKYPVYYTEGVPAKELGREVKIVAYTGTLPEDAEFATYSVAEYLYARLYKDGVVNATEGKDVYRKAVYENLLAYGASAQELLVNYDSAEKAVLVTDYTYVISTVAGATVNGKTTAIFGASSAEITLSYVGEGSLVGWTVTDISGEATEYETSTITVSGVVTVEPIFGVHECVDVDPADHYCDVCGEVTSECADGNDKDHKCDLCGNVIENCNDADGNGACDECGNYAFEQDVTSGVSLYTFTSQSNANPTEQTSITPNSTSPSYYGALAIRAQDPANAANNVLKMVINGGVNNSNTSGASKYLSRIKIAASSKIEGGNIHVIEYDFYAERFNKAGVRNFLELWAYDTDGNSGRLQNGAADGSTNGHTKAILQVTGTEKTANAFQIGVGSTQTENSSYALFDSHTWYRFRFVYDVVAGTITAFVSFDSGVNWYLATATQASTSLSNAGVDATKIDYLAFAPTTYGHGEIFYIDNVNYYVTNSVPEAHAESGIDSIEALYRK